MCPLCQKSEVNHCNVLSPRNTHMLITQGVLWPVQPAQLGPLFLVFGQKWSKYLQENIFLTGTLSKVHFLEKSSAIILFYCAVLQAQGSQGQRNKSSAPNLHVQPLQ